MSDHATTARILLDAYPRTFAEQTGAEPASGRPSDLYRTLCVAILSSARISADLAIDAARALAEAGLTTARAMADSTWRQRTDILNGAGYARYDESTSRMLGDGARLLVDRYGGDLRRLRDEAGRDPERIGELVQDVKGIGPTGADIFRREVQAAWDELYPFVDDVAAEGARAVGLPSDAGALADLAPRRQFARLVSALVATRISGGADAVAAGEVPLEARTKEELYEAAREADVEGRSSMTKDQLVDALRDT